MTNMDALELFLKQNKFCADEIHTNKLCTKTRLTVVSTIDG